MANILELARVTKLFRPRGTGETVEVFADFNLSISAGPAGEIVVLLGSSGSGKTTLLKLISGLIKPDRGTIRVLGHHIDGPNPYSAMVPQSYTCFPWLSAQKNVEFGLALRGIEENKRAVIATDYLTKVGLADRSHAYPSELSGGMQQRVAIARTLAVRPQLVLMDEPFGALDSQIRAQMQHLLLALWEQERNFVLFVTHDIQEALLLADRVFVLPPRPIRRVLAEIAVPFQRPRAPEIVYEPAFIALTKQLRELLDPNKFGEGWKS